MFNEKEFENQVVQVTCHELRKTKLLNRQGHLFEDKPIEFQHMGITKGEHYMKAIDYKQLSENQCAISDVSNPLTIWREVETRMEKEALKFLYSISDFDCTRGSNLEISDVESLIQSLVKKRYIDSISGVTEPWTYVGSAGAPFGYHPEDSDLPSLNIQLHGATKLWCFIHPEDRNRLDDMISKHHKVKKQDKKGRIIHDQTDRYCSSYLRHKSTFLPLWLLKKWYINFTIVCQRPGDLIITMPNAIHGGINAGYNINVAMNVASKSWIPYGLRATYVS